MRENENREKTGRKIVTMNSRGVTKDQLIDMYFNKNYTQSLMRKKLNVSELVLNRWFEECNIEKKITKFSFNKNFFDNIDTEEKAYWLGFIWCDGYASERFRGKNGKVSERPVKITVAIADKLHLKKLQRDINSNHPINMYQVRSFDNLITQEARLTLNDKYFGSILISKYGMIPHRTDASQVLKHIPLELERHFLRGVFDADGSLSVYHLLTGNEKGYLKSTLSFSTHTELVAWIQDYMIRNNIKDNIIKTSKRHGEGSDGDCVILSYTGVNQVDTVASHLYEDATVFLDRKYDKYLELLDLKEKRKSVREKS